MRNLAHKFHMKQNNGKEWTNIINKYDLSAYLIA